MRMGSRRKILGPAIHLSPTASLRGLVQSKKEGPRDVNTFLGVPYAEPPERFAHPKTLKLWEGERHATKYGAICPQDLGIFNATPFPVKLPKNMSEDCLFLNIWTPNLQPDANLPVMLWIHGGGFTSGWSNLYSGLGISSLHDVVIVTINYRLGCLGFFSTYDKMVPGNMGLLDQIEALKWVQKYIKNFGGDPGNVTVFGESAGGSSVSLLVLSELTEGLFKRAICQSGVAIAPWVTKPSKMFDVNKRKAKKLGCSNESSTDIVNFLKSLSMRELVQNFGQSCSPVVDNYVLKDSPESLYQRQTFNKVELINGFNSHEGALFFTLADKTFSIDTVQKAKQYIVYSLKISLMKDFPENHSVVRMVTEQYIPECNRDDPEKIKSGLIDFFGDLMFIVSSWETSLLHAGSAKTFHYLCDFRPSLSPHPEYVNTDHGMEIFYLFGIPLAGIPGIEFEEWEKILSQQMMQYWVNFAKNGDPNGEGLPHWPVFDPKGQKYLTFKQNIEINDHIHPARMHFWKEKLLPILKEDFRSKY